MPVFVGLLDGDHISYFPQDPGWTPTLTTNGNFTMTDLLKVAGVVHPLT